MPQWPSAVYYDAGQKHELRQPDLAQAAASPQARAKIRELVLWDTEEEYRLMPRFRDGSPHFYSPQSNVRTLHRREEKSQEHNKRRDQIAILLNSKPWTVGFYDWEKMNASDSKEKIFTPLFQTEGYAWDKEIARALTSGTRCVHDVFGAKLELRTSERFPWFAVEVIDTHYPDDKALAGWLSASLNFPYVVAFDFVAAPKYFFNFEKDDSRLRMSYYIYDGRVWNGSNPWQSTPTAKQLKEHMQEAIKKYLMLPGRH